MTGLIARLLGQFAGALLITGLFFCIAFRYTGHKKKGALRAFFICFLVVWSVRIAAWKILDAGNGDISLSLLLCTISLLIWFVVAYKNGKRTPVYCVERDKESTEVNFCTTSDTQLNK